MFGLCQLCSISQREQNIWGNGCVCYLLREDRGEVESNWNVMAQGDAWEGKWRGSDLRTWHFQQLLQRICTLLLPIVDWTEAPTELNGLMCSAERWNQVYLQTLVQQVLGNQLLPSPVLFHLSTALHYASDAQHKPIQNQHENRNLYENYVHTKVWIILVLERNTLIFFDYQ